MIGDLCVLYTTHHDWPVKKATVDLLIRLKGNLKHNYGNLLSLWGGPNKNLNAASKMLPARVQ